MEWSLVLEAAITISGMGGLILYRLKRKFKNDRVDGVWLFVDRNIVELILAGVLVPDWQLILKLFQ